ncbi:unnamed protein product [Rodentolepis nana]|uniref:VWFC domain-containing protein n=1 Tax=Rodentolepis nana TaxID=102285 RepID=A0A0R3TP49_RODNA|nr:unnamed protein product [Rodentolepis nana]
MLCVPLGPPNLELVHFLFCAADWIIRKSCRRGSQERGFPTPDSIMAAEPCQRGKPQAAVSGRFDKKDSGRYANKPRRFLMTTLFHRRDIVITLALIVALVTIQPSILVAAQRGERTCMLEDGRVLQPGEVMEQSRSCMACICNGDTGEVDCERQNCPDLDCGPEGTQPAEPGECCPRCRRKLQAIRKTFKVNHPQ